jgi:hypothetical protein
MRRSDAQEFTNRRGHFFTTPIRAMATRSA